MADILKSSYTLKIENVFVDGDTRTITLKNPKDGINQNDITSLNSWMQVNQPIIGDKWSGTFAKIAKVKKVEVQTRSLDFSK